MDRATAIRTSLTAFLCGLIGFLPVLGLLPAFYALRCWIRIRTRYRDEWNPAAVYLDWGVRLALFGVLLTALLVGVIMVA
jgi:hypothetical protein